MSRIEYDDFLLRVIGARLKQLREQNNLTVKEMSKISCIDLDNYKRVEKGIRNSSIGLIYNIAKGLKITPNDIFNDDYKKLLNYYQNERDITDFLKSHSFMVSKDKVIKIILRYRKKHKISQQNMSVLLNITRDQLNNFENGRGKINIMIMLGLLKLENLNLEDFLKVVCIESNYI